MTSSAQAQQLREFALRLKETAKSDFPLAEAIRRYSREAEGERFKKVLGRVAGGLDEGTSLADALAADESSFSPEFVALVRAGEECNDLEGMLEVALEHEAFIARLDTRLRAAVQYPLFCFILSLVLIGGAYYMAGPYVKLFYEGRGIPLPFIFQLSEGLLYGSSQYQILIYGALALGGYALVRYYIGMSSFALMLPGLSKLMGDVFSARLARSLGIMLTAGVRADEALAAAAASTSDRGMRRALMKASKRAGEGENLSKALAGIGLDKSGLLDLAEIGEESGELPSVLLNGASLFKAESESRLEVVMTLLGTILLLLVGAWMLLIVSGWFTAYFNIAVASEALEIL